MVMFQIPPCNRVFLCFPEWNLLPLLKQPDSSSVPLSPGNISTHFTSFFIELCYYIPTLLGTQLLLVTFVELIFHKQVFLSTSLKTINIYRVFLEKKFAPPRYMRLLCQQKNSMIYPSRIMSTQNSIALDIGLLTLFSHSIKKGFHSFGSPPWNYHVGLTT